MQNLLIHRSPAAAGTPLATARAWLTDALRRWRGTEQTRLTAQTLERLDDRTLRDLGFHRSEIPGLALELSGRIEPQHWRVLDTLTARS